MDSLKQILSGPAEKIAVIPDSVLTPIAKQLRENELVDPDDRVLPPKGGRTQYKRKTKEGLPW